jgi:hypothetical protein
MLHWVPGVERSEPPDIATTVGSLRSTTATPKQGGGNSPNLDSLGRLPQLARPN